MSEHVSEWLSAYVDGELDKQERLVVEAHVSDCQACQSELEEMTAIQQNLSFFYQTIEEPDFQFETVVLNKIAEKKQHSRRIKWLWLSAGFVMLLILLQISSVITTAFTMTTILLRISTGLIQIVPKFLTAFPGVTNSLIMVCSLIVVMSGWSIKRLLRTNVAG